MASKVKVVGGGHPQGEAVRQFFLRVDKDPQWHPGKRGEVGRPKELTGHKRHIIAKSMMAKKKAKIEPCYEAVLEHCPNASINPTTGRPFSRNAINDVLTTDCYDNDPEKPWQFRYGTSRKPLTPEMMQERWEWAKRLLREGHESHWFFRNVVWMDICSKVIPGSPQKAYQQAQAGKNKRKRLMSVDARSESQNLGAPSTAERQCSQGDTRVYFVVVLTRGVLGAHTFTNVEDFTGETQAGAAKCVEVLPQLLRKMGMGENMPRTLFTDRGPGFYHRTHGSVTSDYAEACKKQNFKLWAGSDAKRGDHAQPPDIGDVLLHETAMAWVRAKLAKTGQELKQPWKETPRELGKRLAGIMTDINQNCDVDGLCREFPERLETLKKRKGGRLDK